MQGLLVRVGGFLAPIVASYGAARIAAPGLWHPIGWPGMVAHVAQVAVVGIAAALLCERAVRRVLPLASLLNLTLVFPDRAPSRFGVALRAGTIRHLERGAARLPSDHQRAAEELVAMVTALGRHERLTRGHTERVRAHADVIAQQLGVSTRDRELLSWGALAHDVGKLTVPAEILSSDGRPSDAEWAILRQHPQAGAEMVEPLAGWLGPWRLAAGQHHERWDGQGYPDGLVGTEIGLAGRIVAVADAFDVITSSRSYKEAMPAEAARQEMVRCAGSQFDPEVVRALLEASLTRPRSQFAFLGWLGELGGWAALPRGAAHGVTSALTAGAVLVAAVTGAATPDDADGLDRLALTSPAQDPGSESGLQSRPGPSGGPDRSEPANPGGELDELEAMTGSSPLTSTDGAGTATTGTTTEVPAVSSVATGRAATSTTKSTTGSPSTTWSGSTASSPSTTTPAPTTITASTTTAPTTTTTTTTTTSGTTTTLPASPSTWELGNPGSGNTVSQALLALAGGLDSGALPNYDTDRDSAPGLLVSKGNGLSESDRTKMQRWYADASATRLQATVSLDLWVATKDFDTGKTGRLVVGLYDCNGSAAACSLLASGSAQFNQATFGSGFGQLTIGLGAVDHTFSANRTLVLKVATTNSSDDDLWLAYGTTTYPTRLHS